MNNSTLGRPMAFALFTYTQLLVLANTSKQLKRHCHGCNDQSIGLCTMIQPAIWYIGTACEMVYRYSLRDGISVQPARWYIDTTCDMVC